MRHMATDNTNVTRPKSRGQKVKLAQPVEWVTLKVTRECFDDIERLRSTRSLNNRIANKPTIVHEAITEALRLETELMRANVNQIMKRVGGAGTKVTG